MKNLYCCILPLVLLLAACSATTQEKEDAKDIPEWAIIIHGGAGNFYGGDIPTDKKEAFYKSLDAALSVGKEILANGGNSLDAVEQTIRLMENDPLFNSGKGAVLTSIGTAELDASIMHGADLNSGAVAGVKHTKHPISAARAVMEKSFHVMMAGDGADRFAAANGIEQVENDYFITENRKRAFDKRKEATFDAEKMGTVGCVALDKFGNIVAGTSTGGTFFKKWGRIGDSPIIGAGTYANNESCGISATGTGEFFIRGTVARDISALMEYRDLESQLAADEIMHKKLPKMDKEKATGGVIGVDHLGNFIVSFNTTGMLRAHESENTQRKIGLYETN